MNRIRRLSRTFRHDTPSSCRHDSGNKLSPSGFLIGVGLFYILSGAYFKVTSRFEPMKAISAYAIATGISATQIQAYYLWIWLCRKKAECA